MNQLLKTLFDRLLVLLGRAFASRVETYSLLEEIESQRLVEEHAQKLESAGYVEAATNLRRRSAQISPDTPAASAAPAMLDLCGDTPSQRAIEGSEQPTGKPKRRRATSQPKPSEGRE